MRREVEGGTNTGLGFRGLALGEQKIIHARMLLCDWQANLEKEARTTDTFLRAARRIFFFFFNFVLSG